MMFIDFRSSNSKVVTPIVASYIPDNLIICRLCVDMTSLGFTNMYSMHRGSQWIHCVGALKIHNITKLYRYRSRKLNLFFLKNSFLSFANMLKMLPQTNLASKCANLLILSRKHVHTLDVMVLGIVSVLRLQL